MKKKILVTLLTLTTLFCFTGCEYEVEEVNVDTETASMDVNIPTLDKELAIPDEDFTLLCTYDTSGYDLSKWHVTDSKTIGMKVKTNNLLKIMKFILTMYMLIFRLNPHLFRLTELHKIAWMILFTDSHKMVFI